MNVDKPFFDTNILLYLLSSDSRADQAETLIADGGVISVQVLNEFASVASRKLKMDWSEIQDILTTIKTICRVVPITLEIHESGIAIAEKYKLSFYDSLILAAASHSECRIVYSEDMQDGQRIKNITIQNPFKRL